MDEKQFERYKELAERKMDSEAAKLATQIAGELWEPVNEILSLPRNDIDRVTGEERHFWGDVRKKLRKFRRYERGGDDYLSKRNGVAREIVETLLSHYEDTTELVNMLYFR